MKHCNNFRRMFRAAAVLATVAVMTFAGCTKVDDTLGSNLVPDNQQMKVGYTTIGARTLDGKLDAAKYVETRLFQSDSLRSSNISYGYMGSMLSDTFGLRTAGFLTQYLNVYSVKEGYFGKDPIFDSVELLITISSYGNDTITSQNYNVYEIKSNKYLTEKPISAGKTVRDSTFYLNFDPVKEGVIDLDEGPIFTFTFPDGKTTGPATTAVTMETTPAGEKFIKRLMLQKIEGEETNYVNDYSIYSTDSLKEWVEEFKGLYIVPAEDQTQPGKGNIYATELESSGFMVYARTRVESDPTLIQDTIGMGYIFYNTTISKEYGNVSVNTVKRDYDKATSPDARFYIADAKEKADVPITDHPTYDQIYVEGMGGVVTAITFDKPFFDALETEITKGSENGQNFKTLAMSQVRMSIYFDGSNYDWTNLTDPAHMIEEMDKSQTRLGLYTNYKTLAGIRDYNYAYEQNYSTTLAYGGYINRSRGCYVMDITGYAQTLWNSYQAAKKELGANATWDDLKEKIDNRTIYLGPEAYSVYTTTYSVLKGMTPDGVTENDVPIKFDITYNLIK